MRIRVDKAACIGTGDCIKIAPGVFQFDEQLLSEVKDPAGADEATVVWAARKCPTHAIFVEDDQSNPVWPK